MLLTMKAARVNKGYTQKEAGEAIGVTRDTVSNWERGRSFPNVNQLKRIENVYGVSYKELIFLQKNNA